MTHRRKSSANKFTDARSCRCPLDMADTDTERVLYVAVTWFMSTNSDAHSTTT